VFGITQQTVKMAGQWAASNEINTVLSFLTHKALNLAFAAEHLPDIIFRVAR